MNKQTAKTRIVLWSVVAAVVVAAMVGAAVLSSLPAGTLHWSVPDEKLEVLKDITLQQEYSSFDLTWYSGEVKLLQSEDASTRLTLKSSTKLKDNGYFTADVSGGTLAVEDKMTQLHFFDLGRVRTVMEVRLPKKEYSRLKLYSGSGSMQGDALQAKVLETTNSSGETDLTGSFGDVTLKNSSGRIRCRSNGGQRLEARNTSGNTEVSGNFSEVKLNCNSGRIQAESSAPSAVLETQVTSGNLNVDGRFESIVSAVNSGSSRITSKILPNKVTGNVTSGKLSFYMPEEEKGFRATTSVNGGSFSLHEFNTVKEGDGTYLCGQGKGAYSFRVNSGSIHLYQQG